MRRRFLTVYFVAALMIPLMAFAQWSKDPAEARIIRENGVHDLVSIRTDAGGLVFAWKNDAGMLCLNCFDGDAAQVWENDIELECGEEGFVRSFILGGFGDFYLEIENGDEAVDYCFTLEGQQIWCTVVEAIESEEGDVLHCATSNGTLYRVCRDNTSSVTCFTADGQVRWTEALPATEEVVDIELLVVGSSDCVVQWAELLPEEEQPGVFAGEMADLFAMRYTLDGTVLESTLQINSGEPLCVSRVYSQNIVAAPEEGWVSLWLDKEKKLIASEYGADGTAAWENPCEMFTSETIEATPPLVCEVDDGVLIYSSKYLQKVAFDGTLPLGENGVEWKTETMAERRSSELVSWGDRFAIVESTDGPLGLDENISMFRAECATAAGENAWAHGWAHIATNLTEKSTPHVQLQDDGRMLVFWNEVESGALVAQSVLPDGGLGAIGDETEPMLRFIYPEDQHVFDDGADARYPIHLRAHDCAVLPEQGGIKLSYRADNGFEYSLVHHSDVVWFMNAPLGDYRVLAEIVDAEDNPVEPAIRDTVYFAITEHDDAVREEALLPESVELNAYPNPFNPATTLNFALPEAGAVKLAVYDVLGRSVAVLLEGSLPAGVQKVQWNASNLAGGVYFVRLETDGESCVQKIMLLK